jgi:hypothetical protein
VRQELLPLDRRAFRREAEAVMGDVLDQIGNLYTTTSTGRCSTSASCSASAC